MDKAVVFSSSKETAWMQKPVQRLTVLVDFNVIFQNGRDESDFALMRYFLLLLMESTHYKTGSDLY